MSRVAVIGAGLMGHGIALTFAKAGHSVVVTDPVPEALASVPDRIAESMRLLGADEASIAAALERVSLASDIGEAVREADVVFEAAPEKLKLKQKLFAEIEPHAPANAILASNTSVIQISRIMGGLSSRARALGTHWWNPPHMIPLVEVVKTEWTDPNCADDMYALLAEAGKTPVMVDKDVIFGFEAVIIGGLGNLWGTLAGGVILGVAQTIGAKIDPGFQILAGYIAFLIVLAIKPNGLFPRVDH